MKKKLLGCLALITAMVCASQAAVVLDVDFSEFTAGTELLNGAIIADQSGNGYVVTLIDTDGDAYAIADVYGSDTGLDTTTHSSGNLAVQGFTLDGTGDFTVEAIINWNGTTTVNNGLFGQIGTLNGGNQLWIRENGGSIQYAVGIEGTQDANYFGTDIDVSAAKADGAYHSFAFIYDSTAGEIRTYLDGVLLHTNTDADIGTLSTALINPVEDINLGAFAPDSNRDFNGIAVQYRVSDTALATNAFLVVPLPPVESDPPTPNPATFDVAPTASGITTIKMTATTGTDVSGGIQYLFTETSGNPGGTSSGWISSPYYEDDGLNADTEYTYTVTMRDIHSNAGTVSAPASATTDPAPSGLYGINLSWEDDGTGEIQVPFTGWTFTSLGSDPMDANDFRAAVDPDNWFPDSTDGNHVMLLEGDNPDEYGRLSQQLTGGPLEGTYTFTVLDVGVVSFGDHPNAQFKFGFSLDGTNMIAGSEMILTEGAELEVFGEGTPGTNSVTYAANGTEDLYLIIETTGNHTGRSIPTVGSCTVDFVPIIDPDPAFLTIENGVGTVTIGCTNLTNIAGVTNMLQSTDNLIFNTWDDESFVTGVTEAEWVFTTTNQNFYRIETTF